MKQLKALLIIAVVCFSFTGHKKAAPSILGYWEIYMTVNNGETETKRSIAMMFNAEGKLELLSKKSGEIMNGKWALKKNEKVVKITFDDKEADHGNYKIQSLTFDKLILEKKGNKVYFDRGEKGELD
jgi:hypothetical protein